MRPIGWAARLLFLPTTGVLLVFAFVLSSVGSGCSCSCSRSQFPPATELDRSAHTAGEQRAAEHAGSEEESAEAQTSRTGAGGERSDAADSPPVTNSRATAPDSQSLDTRAAAQHDEQSQSEQDRTKSRGPTVSSRGSGANGAEGPRDARRAGGPPGQRTRATDGTSGVSGAVGLGSSSAGGPEPREAGGRQRAGTGRRGRSADSSSSAAQPSLGRSVRPPSGRNTRRSPGGRRGDPEQARRRASTLLGNARSAARHGQYGEAFLKATEAWQAIRPFSNEPSFGQLAREVRSAVELYSRQANRQHPEATKPDTTLIEK